MVSKNPRIRHKNTPPCEQEVFFHERFFMPKPYSVDLRERVLKDCDHGMSSEDAARKYSVSISWVYLLRKQRRETGNIAPKKRPKSYHLKLSPYEAEIRQLIADHPDATLVELHSMLSNKDNVTVVTLHNFLHHLNITCSNRKNPTKTYACIIVFLAIFAKVFALFAVRFNRKGRKAPKSNTAQSPQRKFWSIIYSLRLHD